jgi:hypothetical protein
LNVLSYLHADRIVLAIVVLLLILNVVEHGVESRLRMIGGLTRAISPLPGERHFSICCWIKAAF